MYKNVKLLSSQTDLELKVTEIKNYKYSENLNQCVITVNEFYKVCKSQPIVFTKDEENNEFIAVSILGFKKNSNLFVNKRGEWKTGEYIPAYIRRYPFIFVKENNTFALSYDEDCKEISNKKGKNLFDDDGTLSDYTESVLKFMKEYQTSFVNTSVLIKNLEELDILEEANVNVEIDGEKLLLTGFKKVNEEKLNSLDEKIVSELVKNGSYKLIIAHLISLDNFEKILSFYNKN